MLVSDANPPSFLDLDLHLPEPAARLEIGEVVHHLVDGFLDAFQIVRIERAAFGIALGELETAKRNLIEIVDERAALLQADLGLIGGFRQIADQRALIEACAGVSAGLSPSSTSKKFSAST